MSRFAAIALINLLVVGAWAGPSSALSKCRLTATQCLVVLTELRALVAAAQSDEDYLTEMKDTDRRRLVEERHKERFFRKLKSLSPDLSDELFRIEVCDLKDQIAEFSRTKNLAPECLD